MFKYRYKILQGSIAVRTREYIRQVCEARGITILHSIVGKEHIHLLLSCPPSIAPSKILQYLTERSSRLLQDAFRELKKRYWVQHLRTRGCFCATGGTVTEEIIRNYIANQFNEDRDEIVKIEE
ncbi:IS200/IS605 family transposase [Bacillus cereus]|uniref:IS200/IS605 family transposase n=1 Tax=Bacillus cereus TaxID=1396 RepID=UPI0027B9ACFF|nr:IS200/IS605 family transposase [Bacillus cereus]